MSDPSQKPPVAGVGAAAGARGGGSGGALLRYGGGVGARGGRVYSAGRSWTTTPSSLPPSTNPLHAYAVPNPHYHSYRGGDGGRGPWTPRGGGRQLSTYHQNNQLYYPPSPSPMARPHRNKSLIITYPAPAMALPVAPALPLTTGNLLNADTKMLPAEEKETRAAATAASATSKDICDDDVQVDREILEMMGKYVGGVCSSNVIYCRDNFSASESLFSSPHPFFLPPLIIIITT